MSSQYLLLKIIVGTKHQSIWQKTHLTLLKALYTTMYLSIKTMGIGGKTEVNKKQWFLIKSSLIKLKQKLDHSLNLIELEHDLYDFKFIFDNDLQEMTNNFYKYKSFFSQMIGDFITWIDDNIQKYGSIYILGI
ncbi:hypothetical protein ACGH6Q_07720 [Gilliamella sp. BG2]|uniref:hypothetical protein n=1 Tax=Gilliamella sp. BG2 TaxID=3351509 RepID=UPI003986D110